MATRCKDVEAWRFVSKLRPFDLTPCAEEGIILSTILVAFIIAAVVNFRLLAGLPRRERTRKRRWLLWGKLVSVQAELILALAHSIGFRRLCSHSHS